MFGVGSFPNMCLCFLFARIQFLIIEASPLVSTLAVMRYVASGGDRHFSEAFSLHNLLFLFDAAYPAIASAGGVPMDYGSTPRSQLISLQ